jgi:hypothetical protein
MTNVHNDQLPPARTAILAPGPPPVRHGPFRICIVPPQGPVDVPALLENLRSLGIEDERLSAAGLEQLNEKLPALMERLLDDPAAAEAFDKDPGAFRDVLGDELAEALVVLRTRALALRSVFDLPGSGESTRRRTRRRAARVVVAVDPAAEARAAAIRGELASWALEDRSNMEALEHSPRDVIERRYPNEGSAVLRVLMRDVEPHGESDA